MPAPTVPGPLDGADFRGRDQELHRPRGRRKLADLSPLRIDALPVTAGELERPHDRRLEAERRDLPLPPKGLGRACASGLSAALVVAARFPALSSMPSALDWRGAALDAADAPRPVSLIPAVPYVSGQIKRRCLRHSGPMSSGDSVRVSRASWSLSELPTRTRLLR